MEGGKERRREGQMDGRKEELREVWTRHGWREGRTKGGRRVGDREGG